MMLSAAIHFATKAHDGQTRKGSGLPYITHPLEVMNILIRHGVRDPVVLVSGVLHDVVEDCAIPVEAILEEFGHRVAEVVAALTKPSDLQDDEKKRVALEKIRRGPAGARVVKMADRYSNLLDLEVTTWSREKQAAYCREGLAIAELGAADLPALSEALQRLALRKSSG